MVVLTGQDGGPRIPRPPRGGPSTWTWETPPYTTISCPAAFPMVLVSGRRLDGSDLEGVRRAVRESLGQAELGGIRSSFVRLPTPVV